MSTDEPRSTDGECPWWERVSAAVDGELSGSERHAALDHAAGCPQCAALLGLATATAARAFSDTTAERLHRDERRWFSGRSTRVLLVVVAVILIAEAVPTYLSSNDLGRQAHTARHLATWQIAFGVGMIVAGWVSRLSHAMLALAASIALLTVTATVVDVVAGHRGPLAESVHLVELVAVALLWRMTPPHLLPWRRRRPASLATSDDPPRPSLRLVPPRSVDGPDTEP